MNLIGLGTVGKIFLSLLKEEVDNVLLLDDEEHEELETHLIQPGTEGEFKHERFDTAELPKDILSKFNGQENYLVVSGASDVSGASLSILKLLGGNTTVIYIRPDIQNLTNIQKLQEKVTFGVLQETARSGMIRQIMLFDNEHIASFLGDLTIKQYFERINEHIVYALRAYFFCEKKSPIFGKKRDYNEQNRIICLGRVQEKTEILFFPLTNEKKSVLYPLAKTYCFLTPSDDLDKASLLSDLKQELLIINEDLELINYGIYEVESKSMYKMVILETSLVQEVI